MDLSYEEKLDRYAAIADERFETARFEEFCENHLGHLEVVVREFFGTPEAKDAVRKKVAALLPRARGREVHRALLGRIQLWRKTVVGASLPPPPMR